MTFWITHVAERNNMNESRSGIIANQNAAAAVEKIGFRSLYYPRLSPAERQDMTYIKRLAWIEAVFAAVRPGDVVVVQYPLWMGDSYIERQVIEGLKRIPGVKIAALVWDILSWVNDDSDRDYTKDPSLSTLNLFDLVICANEKMAGRLRHVGGVKSPLFAWQLTDILYNGTLQKKTLKKQLYYVSGSINPTLVEEYKAETPIYLIGPDYQKEAFQGSNLHLLGRMGNLDIPPVFDGGFGMINYSKGGTYAGMHSYGEYNNPMKLSMYLAAGLPPLVTSRSAHARWISERNVGLVLDDINEIDDVFDRMTEADYQQILENLKPWQQAVSTGFFVKRACLEAIQFLHLGFSDALVTD